MLVTALLMSAQAATSRTATLVPFKPFIGACWRAELNAMLNDTHCFEAVYGGAHVRDRHEVRAKGKVTYAGETIYSADGPALVFTYVNSLGGVGFGKVGSADKLLGFTGSMRASPNDREQPIDSEWHILDADHYEVRSLVRSNSGQQSPVLKFTRFPRK
jgi:hypothetical protein